MSTFARLLPLLDDHPAASLVTVIGTRGSTPREAGTRLVVAPDGSFSGTIGGGRFEYEALAEASAAAASGEDRFFLHRFALGPELGQCCGGAMTIAVEVFSKARRDEVKRLAEAEAGGMTTEADTTSAGGGLFRTILSSGQRRPSAVLRDNGRLVEDFGQPSRQVILFGAGHVGRALMLQMASLPMFRLTWVDGREGQFPPRVPASVTLVDAVDPDAIFADAEPGAFVLIMTHDHALDLAILDAALREGRAAYVGLIGSDTKRARFVSRLKAGGLDRETAESFVCPVGIDGITSKEPAAIAASVIADLLIRDEAMAKAAHGVGRLKAAG
ncbi:putative xanthine dehydrogenase subunit A [Hartmannibacter diazotrophicus]|uniref:Putative xanthine dehydrogenase subunit A n=1 Tax=Hartmannibacter diazotrophicus TaxID=1482074 RepID=A0A2C9D833_9HYPH|nr:xanthine dehydrogenase accessory protein XdhC [Hartmannibacter diazotrophicus]SON56482.1 putative xanthine dehydrogenase subunit A [Hartmannibacter diazotrophicus]